MRSLMEEAVLLSKAQREDREAFWRLASPSFGAIYGLVQRLVRSAEDVEDVVQGTYLEAMEAIRDFRGGTRFNTWLHLIAMNQALASLRKRRDEVFSADSAESGEVGYPRDLADWSESVLDEAVRREGVKTLESAIEELPTDLMTVVTLRDINGLSNAEAARALGLPVGAVKWRLHRARCLLRDRLSIYFQERCLQSEAVGSVR